MESSTTSTKRLVFVVRNENDGQTIGTYTTIDLAFKGLMTADMTDKELSLTKQVLANTKKLISDMKFELIDGEWVKLIEEGYSIETIELDKIPNKLHFPLR